MNDCYLFVTLTKHISVVQNGCKCSVHSGLLSRFKILFHYFKALYAHHVGCGYNLHCKPLPALGQYACYVCCEKKYQHLQNSSGNVYRLSLLCVVRFQGVLIGSSAEQPGSTRISKVK